MIILNFSFKILKFIVIPFEIFCKPEFSRLSLDHICLMSLVLF